MPSKPRVGIFGLTGCAGDQLVVLNCEDELLRIVELVELRDFVMASSARDEGCHLELAFVEGAVVTEEDERLLHRIRERTNTLVAIGTCALWGGIPAMPAEAPRRELLRRVYGELGEQYDAGEPRSVKQVVPVDAEIAGCPIEKEQFLKALAYLLNGDMPLLPSYPVCSECRIAENHCLLIGEGEFCCGPLTLAGCGARCPAMGVACIGCRGPAPDANVPSAVRLFESNGYGHDEIVSRLTTFAPVAAGRPV